MLSVLFFTFLEAFQIHPPYSRAGCTSPFQPLLSRNHMAPQGPNCSVGFSTNNYSLHILVQIICDIYLKPLKTQLIKMLFFSFITKSHTLFMFKPTSLSHGNVKAKHERHCALRLKISVKNVKIVTFLFNPSQILKLYSI